MWTLSFIAILLSLASLFGLINNRLLHLPSSIGLMTVALFVSLCLLGLDFLLPQLALRAIFQPLLGTRDIADTFLNGALSFLLFAGALHVDIGALWSRKLTVFLLATVGVLMSTALFAAGMWMIFQVAGEAVPFPWCIVLGAVLAPTDPIAVAGMLARVGLSKSLQAVLAGESLFNDGVAVVVFISALKFASSTVEPSLAAMGVDFIRQTGGGMLLGAGTGWISYLLLRGVDDYPLEIMISLALAAGTYVLGNAVGTSGPIAVVAAGVVIGNKGMRHAMSDRTRQNLTLFWSVLDELLNALLFLILGFEILTLEFGRSALLAAAFAIPLSLLVRGLSVIAPVYWLYARNPDRWAGFAILTWGGLRGGISVALALTLPDTPWRSDILFVTYAVVVFTILVQGLTIERFIRFAYRRLG